MSDDFLARENELLGDEFSAVPTGDSFATATGGDIDFDRAASAFPDISLDGSSDIPPPLPAATHTTSGFSFDDFDTAPIKAAPATEVKVTGDDEIEKFESEFPDIEVPSSQPVFVPPTQPTFGATPPFAPRPQPSAFSSTPILNAPLEEDEPQVIKDWREKQAAEIKARDEASKAKRDETVSKAERAIDQFYEEYAAKKEKTIRENKEHEEEFVQSLTDSLSAGTTWQRIADLIELQNSQSKTIARAGAGTTDLTRFKEVLLRLKREGDSAPGAAGY
ncbi:Clathrin light chain [Abortiporus biennis]